MDKMTIEKAREVYHGFDWANKRCGSCEPNYCEHPKARGFIEGYESRDAEVEELKNFVTYCMKYSNDGHVVKMAKKLEESK